MGRARVKPLAWHQRLVLDLFHTAHLRGSVARLSGRRAPPVASVAARPPGSSGCAGARVATQLQAQAVSEWLDADRFFAGLEAYSYFSRQDEAPRLIFTGAGGPPCLHCPRRATCCVNWR